MQSCSLHLQLASHIKFNILRSYVLIMSNKLEDIFSNSKTEFGPGLEQFQQILRFLDPI